MHWNQYWHLLNCNGGGKLKAAVLKTAMGFFRFRVAYKENIDAIFDIKIESISCIMAIESMK